jgi:hypothetical protein
VNSRWLMISPLTSATSNDDLSPICTAPVKQGENYDNQAKKKNDDANFFCAYVKNRAWSKDLSIK